MKTFKVITSWTGYSEVIVQAENKELAITSVDVGDYDTDNEVSTGNGLDYGYENEEIISVEEIKEKEDE
jgi:hypothetical protein